MEPNNFENQIKDKLASREIKPTEMAWDRLDAMLAMQENEQKEKKVSFSWIYIAAVLLAFVFVGFWLFNQSTSSAIITNKNTVVVNDTINNSLKTNEVIVSKKDHSLDNVETEAVIVENVIIKQNKKNSVSDSKNEANELKKITNQNLLEKKVLAIKAEDKTENTEKSIVKQSNGYISGESLLASVENKDVLEVITPTVKTKSSIKINANSLLSTAESEISKEFKATNVDKMVKNFREVKSAFANRNFEE